jgi:hypothetical protein
LGGFPRNNHPGLTRNKLLAAQMQRLSEQSKIFDFACATN